MESLEEEIYQEFYPKIQRRLQNYLRWKLPQFEMGVVEELVQQTFEIFVRKLPDITITYDKLKNHASLTTIEGKTYTLEGYLFGIARNVHREYARKNPLLKFEIIDQENLINSPELKYYPEVEIEILLREFWELLNVEEKYLFELKIFGYTYQEIAGKFENKFGRTITEVNLRKIFQRKINQLAKKYL